MVERRVQPDRWKVHTVYCQTLSHGHNGLWDLLGCFLSNCPTAISIRQWFSCFICSICFTAIKQWLFSFGCSLYPTAIDQGLRNNAGWFLAALRLNILQNSVDPMKVVRNLIENYECFDKI